MSKQQNFYEVLNSTPNSTFDELKSNYKLLILQCHPDKLQQDKLKETTTNVDNSASTTVDPNVGIADDNAEFIMINKAWNTLKDPAKRKLYDAELLLTKFQMHSNIFERLTLDDMLEQAEEMSEEEVEVEKNNVDKNMEQAAKNNQDLAESVSVSKSVSYFYTYNCRCGGQYVIDESAAADNGIYKRNKNTDSNSNTNTSTNSKMQAAATHQQRKQQNDLNCDNVGDKDEAVGAAAAAASTAVADVEVMVECSECSLVIMLSNEKQKSKTSESTTS